MSDEGVSRRPLRNIVIIDGEASRVVCEARDSTGFYSCSFSRCRLRREEDNLSITSKWRG